MVCKHCEDFDGDSIYPYYGLAPHTHRKATGGIVTTIIAPKCEWPPNFREDPQAPGCGTYTNCPHCGDSLKDTANEPVHVEEENQARIRDYE